MVATQDILQRSAFKSRLNFQNPGSINNRLTRWIELKRYLYILTLSHMCAARRFDSIRSPDRLSRQIYPHTSFAEEVDFLQTMFEGSAYVHGPLNSDHWYTYVADDCKRPTSAAADRTLNLMMYDLEPEVAENFYKSDKVIKHQI